MTLAEPNYGNFPGARPESRLVTPSRDLRGVAGFSVAATAASQEPLDPTAQLVAEIGQAIEQAGPIHAQALELIKTGIANPEIEVADKIDNGWYAHLALPAEADSSKAAPLGSLHVNRLFNLADFIDVESMVVKCVPAPGNQWTTDFFLNPQPSFNAFHNGHDSPAAIAHLRIDPTGQLQKYGMATSEAPAAYMLYEAPDAVDAHLRSFLQEAQANLAAV